MVRSSRGDELRYWLMTSPILNAEKEFIELVAGEVVAGVHSAVRHWMSEIEQVLASDLSDSAKLRRIGEIAARADCNSLKEHGRIV
jgi:hypothetical protein